MGKMNLSAGDQTSGDNQTIWTKTAPSLRFEPLAEPQQTDILIVGGGVAGLLTAYQLLGTGKEVIVVEDGDLGSGESGRTSGHLTWSLDTQYYELSDRLGEDSARLIAQAHLSAIELIEEIVKKEKIECHFKRLDGYLFAHPSDDEENIVKEYEVTSKFGLKTKLCDEIPGFVSGGKKQCLHLPDQGQIHLLLFIKGLAEAIIRKGGKIYTQSKAEEFESNGALVNGFKVVARKTLLATNVPVAGSLITHTRQWPYRTYVIALRVPKGSIPPIIGWDTGDQEVPWVQKPYHYVRTEEGDNKNDYLIVGGEDHKTGQDDREEISAETRYTRLEAWAKAHFSAVGAVAARWSGQVINSVDGCGLIGENPGMENYYVITGDSGNGITNGAIGAMLLTDLINGKKNKWAEVFDPSRHVGAHAPGDYLKEVGNMIRQYTEWLLPGDIKTVEELKPGEGAVLRDGLKKLAVHRDEKGKLHICTAVCPHLGAIVQWNADEKTFDCPAHGSRFTALGRVINGPSNGDLGEPDK